MRDLLADVFLLAIPLAALAYVTVIGAGAAVWLAPRFPPDAQAALCPVVGAAGLAVASGLLPLGIPARPLAGALALLGVAATVALRARVARALRAGALPLVVALAAVVLSGAPGLARGDWRVTSLYASTDAYHWSSQARAYLDGPAAAPTEEHPDRLTYERSRTQHWAVALPFGLLQLAWLSDADPADVYGAFAALVFCLLPLAGFAVARACLGWRSRFALAGALALVVNASLLFASHFSWQQQLAGTAFAFAGAGALWLALEPGAELRETVLAALLAAGALGTYRLGFAPYLALLLACLIVVSAALSRRSRGGLGRVGRSAAGFVVLLACLSAASLVALLKGFRDFYSSGGFSTEFKRSFPDGQVAEAVGLVPRVWAIEGSWPVAAEWAWLVVATALAVGMLVAGLQAARGAGTRRGAFLAAGAGLALAAYAVLLLPTFASYLSFKALAYGAPFLVLLALTPVALAANRMRLVVATAFAALAVPSAVVATVAAIADSQTPDTRPTLARAAASVPEEDVIAVAIDDPWEQAWALYYLRERRVSVERPSYLLTAQGRARSPAAYRHRPVAYMLSARARGQVLWRRGELRLVRL